MLATTRFARRSLASAPALASRRTLSTCPITGAASPSTTSGPNGNVSRRGHPELFEVPTLPLFGSTIPQYSNTPVMADGRDYKFWVEARKQFGDFYTFGIPGFGNGLHGTTHILTDPKEMAKVIRSEGKYPSGVVQRQWASIKMWKELGLPIARGEQDGFFGRSTDWKRLRTFLQTDLLSPQAANGYIPGFIRTAELASKGAPAWTDLNAYLNNCAFDMFNNMMLGQLAETANPNTPTDEIMLEFIEAAKTQMAGNNELQKDVYELLIGKVFGIKTAKYKIVKDAIVKTNDIGTAKARAFLEKKARGELDEFEKNSWFAHAIERQASEGSDISVEEMINLSMAALGAAVDTTSSFMAWNLLHIAVHPKVQQRLREELLAVAQQSEGKLRAEIFQRSQTPYLHAVVRESHRLTPVAPINLFKEVSHNIEIHGRSFPTGTFFVFDSYSTGRDPSIFDDHDEFKPERWLPDAVQARKGTPAEIIDNVFFKEPFSQGARKCPGSRVASNETHILLAQLVLDWDISAPCV
ncbi:hypothetical protein ACHAWF_007447, partial [Thalassiosira exigua]